MVQKTKTCEKKTWNSEPKAAFKGKKIKFGTKHKNWDRKTKTCDKKTATSVQTLKFGINLKKKMLIFL